MRLLALSASAVFAVVNSANALSYCAPGEACRHSYLFDYPVWAILIAAIGVIVLGSKFLAYFRVKSK